jgi:hypothetical protein
MNLAMNTRSPDSAWTWLAGLALAVALAFLLASALLQAAAHPAYGRALTVAAAPRPASCPLLPIAARAVDAGTPVCPM